jgi:nucleoside-diphosphate-sugar epimerase
MKFKLHQNKEKRYFKNKNILITGASGFIGKNFLKYISQFECRIFAIYNNTKINLIKNNITYIKCDLLKKFPIKILKYNFDVVYHFAGPKADRVSINNKLGILKGLIIDENVIDYVIKKKIAKFFYASSAGVYNVKKTNFTEKRLPININCDGFYGLSKLVGEEKLFKSLNKKNFVICRFFSVYGKYSNTIINKWQRNIKKNLNISIWDEGKTIRSWLHIDDVISGIVKMTTNESKNVVYNLGSSEKTTLNKIYEIIKNKYPNSKSLAVYNKNFQSGPKERFTSCKNLKMLNWKQKIKLNKGLTQI